MSSPAWTRPARSPAVEEAPYLSHLTTHHSRFTLTNPPNLGRRRQKEENVITPAEEETTIISPTKKVKKRKKKGLDPQVVTAVINAGISPGNGPRTTSPNNSATDSDPLRPGSSSINMARESSSTSGGMMRRGENIVEEGQSRVLNSSARAYTRLDVWTGLDLPEEGPPAFSIPPNPRSLSAPPNIVPVPSSPPPEYPFPISSDPSHLSLPPITLATSPEIQSEYDNETEDLDEFIFNEHDPLVLAWEADRAAELPLDERITRDLDRRLRAEAQMPNIPNLQGVEILDSEEVQPNQVAISDAERERSRFERREIEIAERERDVPRVARALSIYAGRRFAAAAERRQSAAKRKSMQVPPPVPSAPAPIPIQIEPIASTSVLKEEEEESESSGDEVIPAQRVQGNRRFAEAAERRMAFERQKSNPPPQISVEATVITAASSTDTSVASAPPSSTFSLLFPPKPFGMAANRTNSTSAQESEVISIVSYPSTSAIDPPDNFNTEMKCPTSPRPSSSPRPSEPISFPSQMTPLLVSSGNDAGSETALTRINSRELPVHIQYGPRPMPVSLPWSDPTVSTNSLASTSPRPDPPVSFRPPIPPSRTFPRPVPSSSTHSTPSPIVANLRRNIRSSPSVPTSTHLNPSILSTIPSSERAQLIEPIHPSTSLHVAIPEDQFASVRNLMARFEGTTNRRRPPLPPTSDHSYSEVTEQSRPIPQRRHTPIADRFTSQNFNNNNSSVNWGGVEMRKPLPTPPIQSGEEVRVDSFSALRFGVNPLERQQQLQNDEIIPVGGLASGSRSGRFNSVEALREEDWGGRPRLGERVSSASSSFLDVPTPPIRAIVEDGIGTDGAEEFSYTDLDILLARLEDRSDPNYDELLLLGEVMGPAKPIACSAEDMETLGVAKVEVERKRIDKQGRVKTKLSVVGLRCGECTICMSRFRAEEYAVVLPKCLHIFHADCIRRWLCGSQCCALCRADVFEPKII